MPSPNEMNVVKFYPKGRKSIFFAYICNLLLTTYYYGRY